MQPTNSLYDCSAGKYRLISCAPPRAHQSRCRPCLQLSVPILHGGASCTTVCTWPFLLDPMLDVRTAGPVPSCILRRFSRIVGCFQVGVALTVCSGVCGCCNAVVICGAIIVLRHSARCATRAPCAVSSSPLIPPSKPYQDAYAQAAATSRLMVCMYVICPASGVPRLMP